MADTALSHCVTQTAGVPAGFAFAFLSDPLQLGQWSLGCMNTHETDKPGVYTGLSQFDGGRGFFSIRAEPSLLLVDYWVGPMEALVHRISARVIPGPSVGLDEKTCLITLMAWRVASMSDERWQRLIAAHEAEIWLIREQVEQRYRSGL